MGSSVLFPSGLTFDLWGIRKCQEVRHHLINIRQGFCNIALQRIPEAGDACNIQHVPVTRKCYLSKSVPPPHRSGNVPLTMHQYAQSLGPYLGVFMVEGAIAHRPPSTDLYKAYLLPDICQDKRHEWEP